MALPPVFIEFIGSYTGLKATVDGVKTELAEVEAEGGGNLEGLSAVGKAALLGIGVAAVAVAWKTTQMAAQFQSAMLQISTQAGVPKSQLASLGNSVLNLAGQVGFSPDSLAEALYHIESSFASVGIKGPEALNILKVAAEGAATGHADLVDVTNALDAAIASGIPGVQNYSQAMGALNAIVGSGDMQMQDLANALGTGVLAVVKGYGLSLNDVGAALATFGDNNIRGAKAATDLRMAVQAMAVPIKGGDAALKSIGLTVTSLGVDMQKGGLKLALNDLVAHMKTAGVTAKEQGDLITTIFGKKAGGGLAVLVGQIDRLNSKYPELSKGANNFGAAVAANQATFSQKMKDAGAAMDALGIKIGEALLPSATRALGAISDLVGFMTKHVTAMEAFAVGLGAVALGLAVASLASWDFNASLLADPLTWIVVGIVAVVAGLVELVLHWKTVAAWLSGVWSATLKGLSIAWDWVVSATESAWHAISGAITSAWHSIASFFSSAWHTVTDPIVNAWRWVESTTAAVWGAISKFFMKWWPLLLVIFAAPIAVLMALWNHFHAEAFSAAKAVWGDIAGFFSSIWSWIAGVASSVWGGITEFFSGAAHDVDSIFRDVWNPLSRFFSEIWSWIAGVARSMWGGIKNDILQPIESAASTVASFVSKIASAISGGLSKAISAVEGLAGEWVSVGTNIVMGIVHGVEGSAGTLFSSLKSLASNALSSAKSFLGINSPSRLFASEVGQWISHGIAQGVTDYAHVAVNAVRNVSGALTGGISGRFAGPSLGTAGMAGGGSVTNVVQVTVQGTVRSDRDLRDVVQQEMLRLGGRNSATYAPYRR